MRLHIGHAREGIGDLRGRVEIYVEWRDLWVGAYLAPDAAYLCLLPACVIRISRGRKW